MSTDADRDLSAAARSLVGFWEGLLEGYPDALTEDQLARLDTHRETIELYESGVPWEWATSYTGLVEEEVRSSCRGGDAGEKGPAGPLVPLIFPQPPRQVRRAHARAVRRSGGSR